jgi:crotonobetainyl-CoA:carnitine CoA-transferase CaiB-like acyl-CoA transferase
LITTMIGEQVLEYTIDGRQPRQQGNQRPEFAPNDCYRCAGDDGWVAISIAGDDEWRRFASAIDRPEFVTDERFATHLARRAHAPELRDAIEAWTGERDKLKAMETLQRAGVRAGAVRTGAELLGDPHLDARGYYVPIENTRAGHQTLRLAPFHLSETPPRINQPAPTLGQHTEDVLRDLLGLRDAEIDALAQEGVIANSPKGRRVR